MRLRSRLWPGKSAKAADWRREQDGILHHLAIQQGADQNYIEDGIQLLELASEAHQLFLEQEPEEKRRLLGFWSRLPRPRSSLHWSGIR